MKFAALGAFPIAVLVVAGFVQVGAPVGALALGGQAYSIANIGPKAGGGEPSIAAAPNGKLFVSYPGGGMKFYRSSDQGRSWTAGAVADTASGDTCVATDQASAVYQCNLAGTAELAPLQADNWKSVNSGDSWTLGAPAVAGSGAVCGTSCQPFGVDRQWTDAWIPPGKTTANAQVVLMYHDFYGPSQIWVNISNDGGATYGPSTAVLANPALTPSGLTGAGQANFYTICNSIPLAVDYAKTGPHPGRIFVSWLAADAAENATGCNVSQAQAFHTLWVAWSDDGGATWTPQLAFDGGLGHDASTPFAGFTLDNQGNPYFAFAMNLNGTPLCTVTLDASCAYDMYVVWSPDGGTTWQGGNGPTGGLPTPGTPYKVNADSGTHWFPAIAAHNPGEVDVAYLGAEKLITVNPVGKALPGGGAGAIWNLYAAQTLNLNAKNPADVAWDRTKVTAIPMHLGDICNLGIACVPRVSNRNLLDFISIALDGVGCAHIAYTDDNKSVGIRSANQTAGCFSAASVAPAPAPSGPGVTPGEVKPPLPNTAAGGRSGVLVTSMLLAALSLTSGWLLRGRKRRDRRKAS